MVTLANLQNNIQSQPVLFYLFFRTMNIERLMKTGMSAKARLMFRV